jgi:hypothetical protein
MTQSFDVNKALGVRLTIHGLKVLDNPTRGQMLMLLSVSGEGK